MSSFSDKIIFGKNGLESVVSVEAEDGFLNIFTEKNGVVATQQIPNKYWLLAPQPYDNKFIKLQGDLHYKYGRQYDTRKEFLSARRHLRNNDIYSIYDPREASLINKGISYYKGMQPKEVSILAFDLETTGLVHDSTAKILLIANTLRKNGITTRKLFCYNDYSSEKEMLVDWVKYVVTADPSILCGHNIISYDLPYLRYIADRCGVKLNLGRNNSNLEYYKYESSFRVDGSRDQKFHNLRCYGREIIDTYMLAIRYDATDKKYESYGLKQIIKQEKLEVEGRIFYDASKIRDNYNIPEEWDLIKKYAEFDGDDALQLFDLMVPAFFYMANNIPKTMQQIILSASGGQINSILLRSYIQDGHSIPKADEIQPFLGAISFGIPGIYTNVVRYDFSAMYPSIILEYNVENKNKDPKSHFLKLARYFTEERMKNKLLAEKTGDKYYKYVEKSQKIFANSLYGFLSSSGTNFNHPEGAKFITEKGRELLKFSIDFITGKNYEKYWNINV